MKKLKELIPEKKNESPPFQCETLFSLVNTNSTPGFLSIELYGRPPPSLLY